MSNEIFWAMKRTIAYCHEYPWGAYIQAKFGNLWTLLPKKQYDSHIEECYTLWPQIPNLKHFAIKGQATRMPTLKSI